MKKYFVASVLFYTILFSGFAFAQTPPKLFEAALSRSDAFEIAKSELQSTKERFERLQTDPLAIKPDLLEARVSNDLAIARLTAVKLDMRKTLTGEYFAWTEAQDALDYAKIKLEFAQANLNAAHARFKTGAITNVELKRIEAEMRGNEVDATNSLAGLAATSDALKARVGLLPDADQTAETTPRPQRAGLEASLENHVKLIAAKGTLERAKLDFEIKNNEFTANVEKNAAKTVVSDAERNLTDVRYNLKTIFAATWDAYQNTFNAIAPKERILQNAQDELKTQQQRLEKGLISKLVVQQAQVLLAQSVAVLNQTRHHFSLTVIDAATAVNLDLWVKN
jgi:outer membrane protein TolC